MISYKRSRFEEKLPESIVVKLQSIDEIKQSIDLSKKVSVREISRHDQLMRTNQLIGKEIMQNKF